MSHSTGLGMPGHRAPEVGFEAPFDMLTACHERVEGMLVLLGKLSGHLRDHGCDVQASQAAGDVIRYFEMAAPQHHLDEEMHVFPAALALQNSVLDALIVRLKQDHLEMERLWQFVKKSLQRIAVTDGQTWVALSSLEQAVFDAFVALYRDHLQHEELELYPVAQTAISPQQLECMSRDMMRRRGQLG
jgi:hemerythrin-like domain-containing protein